MLLYLFFFLKPLQKNSNEVQEIFSGTLQIEFASIKEKDLRETLQKLVFLNVIIVHDTPTLRERNADDTPTNATLQDITLHNTTGQDTPTPAHPHGLVEALRGISEILIERKISEEIQKSWLGAYPDAAWIMYEVRKAVAWECADPRRKKKRFGPFMTNWFSRALGLPEANSSGSRRAPFETPHARRRPG